MKETKSLYKPVGISLLPEKLDKIDARARELGLSRSKYFQALIDADINNDLLGCTIGAEPDTSIIQVRAGIFIKVCAPEPKHI